MKEGRTPCINPRCKRTGSSEEFPSEMICGKCFRALPAELRNEHRRYWREYRKWDRRITRTSDILKARRMHDIRDRFGFLIERNWQRIRSVVLTPQKPEGLDAFLEEVGL